MQWNRQRQRSHTLWWRNTRLGVLHCDGRSCRHLLRCQQKRMELGLSPSRSSRDVLGDVVMSDVATLMEEAPPLPPRGEPPPEWKNSSETDATVLAAVHLYGHWWRPVGQSVNHVGDGFYESLAPKRQRGVDPENGTQASESALRGEAVRKLLA